MKAKYVSITLLMSLLAALLIVLFVSGFGDSYHQNRELKATDDEMEVYRKFNRICREMGYTSPTYDKPLSAAARHLARGFADSGNQASLSLNNQEVADAIKAQGVTDADFRSQVAFVYRMADVEKVINHKDFMAEYAKGRYTHIGIAVVGKMLPPKKYIMILLTKRPVILEPFPRRVMPGEAPTLRGTLYQHADNLQILLQLPSGEFKKLRPKLSADGTFEQVIPFDAGGGRYRVEVQVDGEKGPQIAALFEVQSLETLTQETIEKPALLIPDLPPAETEFLAEARLFSLINTARSMNNKVQLSRNGRLDQVARQYAKEMIAQGFVAHVSEQGTNIADRVKQAGIEYKIVAENIAVNESVTKAHKTLMESPAHAAMVLDNRFTQVGIGVIFKEGKSGKNVYVVEIFYLPKD